MRVLLAGLSALCLLAGTAHAGSVERTYEAVTHVREVNPKPVLDDPAHVVGTGLFRGLARFDDGEIVIHRYEGWFDLTNGSGRYHGYARWQFEDGSTIDAAYDGSASAEGESFALEATMRDVSGTGRFEGVTGDGEFQGRRYERLENGGSTWLTGTLRLTMPE